MGAGGERRGASWGSEGEEGSWSKRWGTKTHWNRKRLNSRAAGCSEGCGVEAARRLGLLVPSWSCCGATDECFTRLFYKKEEKNVSGRGDENVFGGKGVKKIKKIIINVCSNPGAHTLRTLSTNAGEKGLMYFLKIVVNCTHRHLNHFSV